MAMGTKKGNYHFRRHSWRATMLKYLHCRQMLILICTLVVLECMCVMAELMVDLQGIRVRFDNEEEEVENFLQFMKSNNVSGMADFHGKSLTEVLRLVQSHIVGVLEREKKTNQCECPCEQDSNNEESSFSETTNRQKRSDKSENKVNKYDFNKQLERVSRDLMSATRPNMNVWLKKKRTSGITVTDNITRRKLPLILKDLDELSVPQIVSGREEELSDVENIESKHFSTRLTRGDSGIKPNGYASSSLRKLDKITSRKVRNKRSTNFCDEPAASVFIFSVNIQDSSLYIMSHLTNISGTSVDQTSVEFTNGYHEHIERIQNISHTIKYVGFCILTLMLCETLLKIACLGTTFLKKKIEVFDAFIVVVSFALDVAFIDSKWYESGKDATTILVLLLPWRVVRIVNSFMMTLNHKHKIEMVTVRRAKKRTENKLRKLEHLSVEIRRDVELLMDLCKLKGANEAEIDACIYSKGRGPTTLSAITSFASLMFISTLGKDPSQKDDFKDIYGDLIREVLEDDDDDSDADKADSELNTEKEDDDAIPKNIYYVSRSYSAKSNPAKKIDTNTKSKRRATLPRRHGSCDDSDSNVYYINDGYENAEESGRVRMYTRRESKSLPTINQSKNRSNVVTFEVTTQVTYL